MKLRLYNCEHNFLVQFRYHNVYSATIIGQSSHYGPRLTKKMAKQLLSWPPLSVSLTEIIAITRISSVAEAKGILMRSLMAEDPQ